MTDACLRSDLQTIAGLVRAGEKVLDLGCGDGDLLRYLVDHRAVTGRGIELREQDVLACVRRGLSVRQGNLEEGLRDYPDRSFDTVILSQTIPYLDDPAFILCEMLRVGRRAIVSFPNWGYWRCRLSWLLTGRAPRMPGLAQVWDASPRARPLGIRDFKDLCIRQGFDIAGWIFLSGDRRLRGRLGPGLRATTAIFVLQS